MRYYVYTFLLALALAGGCKKETTYVYDVDKLEVRKPAGAKDNVKSQAEFIAIAYTDITGQTVSSSIMEQLLAPYQAFSDQKLLEQMIVKSFVNISDNRIPTDTEMRTDVEAFVTATYERLYNRAPDEFELYAVTKMIKEDAAFTAREVYFAMMTADEYRYY